MLPFLLLVALSAHVHAQHDHMSGTDTEMEMDMDMNHSSSGHAGMIMYLHWTPGDTILFQSWVPRKPGPIFGACVGLFLLAILDRWLSALRRLMELWWAERTTVLLSRRLAQTDAQSPPSTEKGVEISESSTGASSQNAREKEVRLAWDKIPPFIASHDFARGIFTVFQAAISYSLMLVVMTFNAGFIISVLLGLGTGEVLFGRLAFANFLHH